MKTPYGVFFGLTRFGGTYLALALLLSLAAVRTGSNALYALLAVMISAIVVSGIISQNTLKQLALTLQTPDRIFAGKTVTTRVSLTNTKRLFPSLAIFVEDAGAQASRRRVPEIAGGKPALPVKPENSAIPPGTEQQRRGAFFPILRAGETRSERLEQSFPHRGRRRQTLQVATRFPFGFFLRRNQLPSQELLVYPAIGEISEFLETDIFSGRRESRRRGSGENFYSIREYQDGESARAIDWKATARARKLMAREYASDDELNCLLVLDTYKVPPEKNEPENIEKKEQIDDFFEKAVSLAAGFAAHFIQDGTSLEFLTPEIHIPASSGERHLNRILEVLAVTRQQTSANLFDFTAAAASDQKTEKQSADVTANHSGFAGNAGFRPYYSKKGGRDSSAPTGVAITSSVNMQKLISNQAFSIILTPHTEESFPAGIRRFARIIPFGNV
jgi:uncharacterized protein (DUF58 family)